VRVTGLPVELYEPPAPDTESSTLPLPVAVTVRFTLVGHDTLPCAESGTPGSLGLVVVVVNVVVVVVVGDVGTRRRVGRVVVVVRRGADPEVVGVVLGTVEGGVLDFGVVVVTTEGEPLCRVNGVVVEVALERR
jgi:hypothetical protein